MKFRSKCTQPPIQNNYSPKNSPWITGTIKEGMRPMKTNFACRYYMNLISYKLIYFFKISARN